MNSKRRATKLYLVGCLAGLLTISLFIFAVVWASAGKNRPDYQGYNLDAPWFDDKKWDWFIDMFNMPSIKPQEEGTFQRFPTDSVPRSGIEPVIPATVNEQGLLRDQIPINPVEPTAASIANGRKMYNIYCAACHGITGMAEAPVAKKGMPAPPIKVMVVAFSEAHLYNKTRYGTVAPGPSVMPAYGFQTSATERWNIVNYLKSTEFGK